MFPRLSSLARYTLPRIAGLVRYPPPLRPGAGIARARTVDGPDLSIPLLSRSAPPLQLTNAYYSPAGILFKGRTAYAHGSIQTPTPALLWQSRRTQERLDHASVLGMQHPMSYGDWFRQGLLLLCSQKIASPVLIPQELFDRSYVQRDAQRLGITLHPVPSGIRLQKVTAYYLDGGFSEWLPKDIAAIRAAFHISPPAAPPGPPLYLSREGEPKSGVNRSYPSLQIENFVHSLGGRVIRTVNTSFEDYLALARHAHTVIADHGAAMCNLAWWHATRVIEIQSTHHNDFFITLAAAAGIPDHIIVPVRNLDAPAVQSRIQTALQMPPPPA